MDATFLRPAAIASRIVLMTVLAAVAACARSIVQPAVAAASRAAALRAQALDLDFDHDKALVQA
jgi:hypothetical protein